MKVLIALLLVIASFNAFSKNIMSKNFARLNYELNLKKVNDELSNEIYINSCPGVKLSLSCGNKTCEENENVDNCPADCIKGEIRSYNHEVICNKVKTIFEPTNASEVQEAIKTAINNGMKVRTTGNLHSASTQLCTKGVVISTKKLNKILRLEKYNGEDTVHVQAGVTIGELSDWLHKRNKSLGYTMIGYRGVTVAGSTATGSHGSSPKHNTVMAALIRSITVINSKGELVELNKKNTTQKEWKAFKTSLGMLGPIVSLRLKVMPQFNLRVKVSNHKIDEITEDGRVDEFVKDCDWGQINWFPGSKKFIFACGYETNEPAEPGARNSLLNPDIPKFIVKPFKTVIQLGACHNSLSCMIERVRYWQFNWRPYFKKFNKKGKLVSSDDVIGPSHMMTSSTFTDSAEGFFQMDWEIAVPASKLHEAMLAVNELVKEQKVCLPLVGIFVRFTRANDETLLAHSTAHGKFKKGELISFIEMPVYLPTGFSKERLAKYEKAYEDFARMLVEKFDGRAHWGKNRDWVFKKQKEMGVLSENFKDFQAVIDKWDPYGMFSNKFGENIGFNWIGDGSDDCTDHYSPVCDKEGNKYKNTCLALKAGKETLSCQQ